MKLILNPNWRGIPTMFRPVGMMSFCQLIEWSVKRTPSYGRPWYWRQELVSAAYDSVGEEDAPDYINALVEAGCFLEVEVVEIRVRKP